MLLLIGSSLEAFAVRETDGWQSVQNPRAAKGCQT